MNIIQTSAGALQVLGDALSSSPSLMIRLFDNNLAAFTDATVLTDLNEASFSGYAAVNPGWSTPALSSGIAQTVSGTAAFTYSGGSSTTVYGFYLTDSSGTKFYGGNKFSSPVTLDTLTTTLNFQATYQQTSQY